MCCWAAHAGPNDVPSEKGGAGANGYTYFVCNQLGGALARLPLVKPSHIKAARQVKKFVSGKLEAQVSQLLHEETCSSMIAMNFSSHLWSTSSVCVFTASYKTKIRHTKDGQAVI